MITKRNEYRYNGYGSIIISLAEDAYCTIDVNEMGT